MFFMVKTFNSSLLAFWKVHFTTSFCNRPATQQQHTSTSYINHANLPTGRPLPAPSLRYSPFYS